MCVCVAHLSTHTCKILKLCRCCVKIILIEQEKFLVLGDWNEQSSWKSLDTWKLKCEIRLNELLACFIYES